MTFKHSHMECSAGRAGHRMEGWWFDPRVLQSPFKIR